MQVSKHTVSGLAKADCWNPGWAVQHPACVIGNVAWALTQMNVLSRWADRPLAKVWLLRLHSSLDRVCTRSRSSRVIMRFVICGMAVLFAGIMKWYWYGSGNRNMRTGNGFQETINLRQTGAVMHLLPYASLVILCYVQRKPEGEKITYIFYMVGSGFPVIVSIT